MPSPVAASLDPALSSIINHINQLSFAPITSLASYSPYHDNLSITSHPHDHDADFSKIITPYSHIAFQLFLEKASLTHQYPELPFKIRYGFPLAGSFAPLDKSYIPDNLPSADIHRDVIHQYILDEITLGRFTGPFRKDELESKIGYFRSSPVQVVVKPGVLGKPDKFRCCRNLSYKGTLGRSINDDINSDDYPTVWYTASDCAVIVSSHIYLSFFLFLLYHVLRLCLVTFLYGISLRWTLETP